MKILFLSHTSEMLGGAERSMLDLIDTWQSAHKVEVEMIVRKPLKGLIGELKNRNIRYHSLDYTFWSDGRPPTTAEAKFKQSVQNTDTVVQIERIIKKVKPDVVMTNTLVCPWAAIAAYYQNVTHIWFIREYGDLDHGREFLLSRKATLEDVDQLSDMVVTISESIADYLKKYIDPKKVEILYNPFKVQSLLERSKQVVRNPFKSKKSLKLVVTGNIAVSKGQLSVIKAVDEVNRRGKNVELCIIGAKADSEHQKQIDEYISKNRLSKKIHMIGFKPDPIPYISHADVGVMTSRKEAFGRVTFEYLVLSKAVIGADAGATPEMVVNNKTGLLYELDNQESLVKAILNYAENPQLAKNHGASAYAHAIAMMRSGKNAENLFKKIQTLLSKTDKSDRKHISIIKHWVTHSSLAQEYIHETNVVSLKKILPRRIKRKIKWIYDKNRSRIAATLGK